MSGFLAKGTRILIGTEASNYRNLLNTLVNRVVANSYGKVDEVILPSISSPSLWRQRTSEDIDKQLYLFKDKADREICLMPEATAIIQEMYNQHWSKSLPKPIRLFYVTKCYRYERPQEGRYREFTQFGFEILGPNPPDYLDESISVLEASLKGIVNYDFNSDVERGLSYYTRNGFEASVEELGAQKQIAGGGVYNEGCGWAIGVDRLLLAINKQSKEI